MSEPSKTDRVNSMSNELSKFINAAKENAKELAALFIAIAAVAVAWNTVVPFNIDVKVIGTIATTLILILTLQFNFLPSYRARRERNWQPSVKGDVLPDANYFTTSDITEDKHNLFKVGYESYLNWIRNSKSPILQLTGMSGAGKSSMISAYLSPSLQNGKDLNFVVILIKDYQDPFQSLRDQLLQKMWKNKPNDFDNLTHIELAQRTEKQLPKNGNLLIVFDQFEDLYIMNKNGLHKTANAMKEFIERFQCTTSLSKTKLLFSYREDYHQLLDLLNLPIRIENDNWLSMKLLEFSTARIFLNSCPGLTVPADRMGRVLREAELHENGGQLVRPIILNLFGIVLRRMANHPNLWKSHTELLKGYVRAALGSELKEERAKLLREYLTDFKTKELQILEVMAPRIGLTSKIINQHLEYLSEHGLVRCHSLRDTCVENRVWQISHDFVANLLERVLDGIHRTFWRRAKPWVAWACLFAFMFLFPAWIFIKPWYQEREAIRTLGNAGFTWNIENQEIEAGTKKSRNIESLDAFNPQFKILNPKSIDLSATQIKDLNVLNDLQNIEVADMHHCYNLVDISGLRSSKLRIVNFDSCPSLETLGDLKDWNNLATINLSNCHKLQSIECLQKSASLRTINLRECSSIVDLNGLRNCNELISINLFGCTKLKDIDGIHSCTSLKGIDLSECIRLSNINGLSNCSKIQVIELSFCKNLLTVKPLQNLTAVHYIDLSLCVKLDSFDGIQPLKNLTFLEAGGCKSVTNANELSAHTRLDYLGLRDCQSLKNIDGLFSVGRIDSIDLRGCNLLTSSDLAKLKMRFPKSQIALPDDHYGPGYHPIR